MPTTMNDTVGNPEQNDKVPRILCALRNHKNINFLSKELITLIHIPEYRLFGTPCNVGFLLPSADMYFFLRVDAWSLPLPLICMQ
jgi:hypothetical protein